MSTIRPPESPLLGSALAALDDEATPAELARRLAAAGASLAPGVAEQLLADLRRLGLARMSRVVDGVEHVVPTSLGLQARRHDVRGEPAIPLAELEALRSELLSTIAHELRTPLTAIRTSVAVLADPAAPPSGPQREALVAAIDRNAARMSRLLGEILDLARFRSGSIRLQLRRFDARELARTVVAGMTPLADAAGVSLELTGSRPAPTVFGDRRRLEQALVNLVSNAIRFSPRDARVTLDVDVDGAADDDEATRIVRWTVTDRGPGIPSADRARLFERFFVGQHDRAASRDGVGLGLPTALAIAQAHGGSIEVDSEVGRGSRFTLAVPAAGPGGED